MLLQIVVEETPEALPACYCKYLYITLLFAEFGHKFAPQVINNDLV